MRLISIVLSNRIQQGSTKPNKTTKRPGKKKRNDSEERKKTHTHSTHTRRMQEYKDTTGLAVIKVLGETKLPVEVRGRQSKLVAAVLLHGEDVVYKANKRQAGGESRPTEGSRKRGLFYRSTCWRA